ncbi:MAG: hypothetical protein IJA35_06315 [Clostridia bacterium]|nr:hypothetical protein [Clostridia bacterium]
MNKPQELMGVYGYFAPDARVAIGFSRHVYATKKRLDFELKLNACSYKMLQQLYNECGTLEFKLLETYKPSADESDIVIDAHLKALLLKWEKQFGVDAQILQMPVL